MASIFPLWWDHERPLPPRRQRVPYGDAAPSLEVWTNATDACVAPAVSPPPSPPPEWQCGSAGSARGMLVCACVCARRCEWGAVPALCQGSIITEKKARATAGRFVLFPPPGVWELTARVRFAAVPGRDEEMLWAGTFGRNTVIEVGSVRPPPSPRFSPALSPAVPASPLVTPRATISPPCGSPSSSAITSARPIGVAPPSPPGVASPAAAHAPAIRRLAAAFHALWAAYPPTSRAHCELHYVVALLAAVILPGLPAAVSPSSPVVAEDDRALPSAIEVASELVMGLSTLHLGANRAKALRMAIECSDADALRILAGIGALHSVAPATGSSLYSGLHRGGSAADAWPVPLAWRDSDALTRVSTPTLRPPAARFVPERASSSSSVFTFDDGPRLAGLQAVVCAIGRWACGGGKGEGIAVELLSGCVRECPLPWLSRGLIFFLVHCLSHSPVRCPLPPPSLAWLCVCGE